MLDVLGAVVLRIADRRREEEADQLREGLRDAVVRGRRGQDQGDRARGEDLSELVAQRSRCR